MLADRLRPGDTVGVVALSNQVQTSREQVEAGISRLQELGFRVKTGPHLWGRSGPASGTVEERLHDLHSLWADPDVKAIISATGGGSAITLVDRLDYTLISRHPKLLIGMSDISPLLNAIYARTGLVTIHHSCLAEGLGSPDADREAPHLLQLITQPEPAGPLPGWTGPVHPLRPGPAEGPLLVGNLPCLGHLLGTPYWPQVEGAILCLEPTGLTSAALLRWLRQFRLTGALDRAAGLVFGHLERCCTDWPDPAEGLQWAVAEGLGDTTLPVYQTEAFGHMVPNAALPVGATARVDADGVRLTAPAVG